jgi:spore germination protein GerM
VSRRPICLALAGALVLAAVGCGVPTDDQPREITQTTIAPTSEVPTTIAGSGADQVSVYFLRDGRLERQGYPVEGEPTVQTAIGFVLEPPAEGASDELRSSVPPGTRLNAVEVSGGVATVDLSGEVDDVSGTAQKEAFAQIVFTTLAFEGIDEVRFLVDGQPIAAPTDDGNLELISADNYEAPLNPR